MIIIKTIKKICYELRGKILSKLIKKAINNYERTYDTKLLKKLYSKGIMLFRDKDFTCYDIEKIIQDAEKRKEENCIKVFENIILHGCSRK